MNNYLIQSNVPVTLVGGGELGAGDLEELLAHAPRLIAADGGAASALGCGFQPEAVIGDLDSLSADAREKIPEEALFRIAEQDSTDFDKALRSIAAPLVLGCGFFGGRIDHQLAVFNVLVRRRDCPCILLGGQEIVFHAPADLEMELGRGDVVSLFPMAAVTGRSEGLEWPIDGLQLSPVGRIGTSNRATGGRMRLQMDGPGLLVILPRSALGAAMRAIAPSR